MDWLEGMNRALDYLEDRMTYEVNIDEAARIACSSKFHFQRMFSMLCGVTVADYVRSRRLTLAAQELALGDCKVLDAALKYGYETPEAFNRAFRRFHGISPSESRELGATLKSTPRLQFILSVKGVSGMDFRIIKKDAFRVVGKSVRVGTADGANFNRIPQFWDECMADGTWETLGPLDEAGGCMGICANFSPDMTGFDYLIAVANQGSAAPAGFVELTVPALTWAVFDAMGKLPSSIQAVTTRIFAEWFPASAYEHADGPELEVYPAGDTGSPEYRCEVWMPIVRKQQ